MKKFGKLFLHTFLNIRIFCDQKLNLTTFQGVVCMSRTRNNRHFLQIIPDMTHFHSGKKESFLRFLQIIHDITYFYSGEAISAFSPVSQGNYGETFTSRIKASHLAEMLFLIYTLMRNMAPLANRPLMYVGAMKMGRNISYIFNFSFSESIPTKFDIQAQSKKKLFCS